MLAAPDVWRDRADDQGHPRGPAPGGGAATTARTATPSRSWPRHQGLLDALGKVRQKLQADREAKPDPIERELLDLEGTLLGVRGVFSGEALRIIPRPDDPKAAWYSLADLDKAEVPQVQRLASWCARSSPPTCASDAAGVQTAGAALAARLAELAPGVYPARKDLAIEVHYNRAKPFRTAWLLYLLGFLALLASFPLASRPLSRAGMALVVGGFLSHAYGMALRVIISGRPPVTNMYESVVWVAFGGMLFALVFEAVYKARYFAACASALAVICLILADNVPILDGSIEPLVPVLRDNMWLTIHVLTITLGYAAFTLAMGIGHLNLGLYFFRPAKAVLFKTLSLFLYRAVQVGTLFLAVGTLLGGVWASYSWGRFWGWDPKETWALIALLGYLALLHGRMVGLDQGLRHRGGVAPRLPARADGLVRGELRPRDRAALVRLRLRRLRVRRGLRGLRGARDRRRPAAPPDGAAEARSAARDPRAGPRSLRRTSMKKVWALSLLALLVAVSARAGEQMVPFKSGDEQASGLLVTPEGKGPFPAVIAIQEWWGLNDWVKDQARALAREGYVALAVDLYRGKVATTQEDAHQLMMGTPPDRALRDLQAAFAYLQAQATARKDRIGSIGWCMGGRYTPAARDRRAEARRRRRLLRRAADRPRRDRGDPGAGARQLRRRGQGTRAGPGARVRGGHEQGRQDDRRQDLRRRRPRLRQRQQPLGRLPQGSGRGRLGAQRRRSSRST